MLTSCHYDETQTINTFNLLKPSLKTIWSLCTNYKDIDIINLIVLIKLSINYN